MSSSPCRFVVSICQHFNIPFEYVNVNLMAGEQKSPEHLKINPNGKIPIL